MTTFEARSLGEILRRSRLAAELTQEGLAERTGLGVRTVSDLERDAQRNPRKRTIARVVAALDLSEEDQAAVDEALHHRHATSILQPHPPSTAPLVGRARELAVLERHLHGEGPPVLLLAGEPGIGKSHLLHEVAARAARLSWHVLEGGCRRTAQQPYAPLLDALKHYIDRRSPAHLWADLKGCAWLIRLLPELVAAPIEPLPACALPLPQERRLMFDAVACFLRNVAGPSGTLLVLDDLQWAGPDALDLLGCLARTTAQPPLRVIGAYRDTEVLSGEPLGMALADLAHAGLAGQQVLAPLPPIAARQLLDDVLDDTLGVAGAVREQLIRRCGGVPFFIASYARTLRAGGSSEDEPWDVRVSLRQRIAALPVSAHAAINAVAVLGRKVPRALVVAVVARSMSGTEDEVLDALETAIRARLLEEAAGEGYAFTYDVIRRVVESEVSATRRALLYRRAAELLEAGAACTPSELPAYHDARGDAAEMALHA